MLFAMVWGDSAASAVLRPRRLQTVVLCSLGFYCLAKSYSFYTGANHLHSIISPAPRAHPVRRTDPAAECGRGLRGVLHHV